LFLRPESEKWITIEVERKGKLLKFRFQLIDILKKLKRSLKNNQERFNFYGTNKTNYLLLLLSFKGTLLIITALDSTVIVF
jgi:hypothetical protein